MPDNAELIDRMSDAADEAREALQDFERTQEAEQDHSKKWANAQHILSATAALDAFENAIGGLAA